MQNTTNYNLKKPEGTDFYNIENENDNMDIIDAELKEHDDAISELNTNFTDRIGYSGGITWLKGYDSSYEYRLQMEDASKLMFLRRTLGSSGSFDQVFNFGQITSLFQIKQYSASYSVSANSELGIKGSDFNTSAPSGYSPVAIVYFSTGHGGVCMVSASATATGTTNAMIVRNITNSTQSGLTARLYVLYVRPDAIAT